MAKNVFLEGLSDYERKNDRQGIYNAVTFLNGIIELPNITKDEVKPLLTLGDYASKRTRVGIYIDGPTVNLTESSRFNISERILDVDGYIETVNGRETLIVQGIDRYSCGWAAGEKTEKFARVHKLFLLSQVVGRTSNLSSLAKKSEAELESHFANPEYDLENGKKLKRFITFNRKFVLDKTFSGVVCTDVGNQGQNIHAVLSRTTLPTALFQMPGIDLPNGLEMDERYCSALEHLTGTKLDYHVISTDKGRMKCITRL